MIIWEYLYSMHIHVHVSIQHVKHNLSNQSLKIQDPTELLIEHSYITELLGLWWQRSAGLMAMTQGQRSPPVNLTHVHVMPTL